jgi:hypothetical protein
MTHKPSHKPSGSPAENPQEVKVESLDLQRNPITQKLEKRRGVSEKFTDANKDKKAKKNEAVDRTAEELAAMKLEAESKKNEKTNAPAPTSEKPREQWWNPTSWTPEEKEKAAHIAVIGGVVVGGLLLTKWLWGKTKKAGEAVKQKTSKVWKVIKFAILAGLLTVGGYIGIKGFNKMQRLRKIESTIEDLKKQLENASEATRKELEKRIALLEAEAARLKNPKATQDTKKEPEEPLKNGAEEVKEEVKKFLPERYFAAMGIARFFGETNDNLILSERANQIHDIITHTGNKALKMSDVLGKKQPFAIIGDDKTNREKSADTIVRFCDAQHERVTAFVERRDGVAKEVAQRTVQNMTLDEFLTATASSYGAMMPVIEAITESGGNVAKAIEKIDMNKLMHMDETVQAEIEAYMKSKGYSEKELREFSFLKLMQMASQMHSGTVSGREPMAEDSVEAKVMNALVNEVKNGDTHLYLLPCFHDIFPDEEEALTQEQKIALVKKYLLERMSPAQAIRLYLCRRMMENGNPAGLMLMQLEVLKYVGSKESGEFITEKKYRIVNAIAAKVAGKSAAEIAEEWQNLNLNINPELIENAGAMMTQIFEAGVEGATRAVTGAGREGFSAYVGMFLDHPIATSLVSVPTAFVVRDIYREGSNPSTIFKRLQVLAETHRGDDLLERSLQRMRPLVGAISVDDFKNAETGYLHIKEALERLPESDKAKDTLYAALRSCNSSHGTKPAWEKLARLISKHPELGTSKADDAARMFMNNPGMRRAVAAMRHPALSRIPLFGTLSRAIHGGVNIATEYAGKTYEYAGKTYEAISNSPWIQELLEKTGTKIDDVMELLSKIDVPPSVIVAFTKTKGALQMLLNASKGGAAAMEYLMKLGAYAEKLKPALGGALVGLDVLVCAIEMAMNRIRIAGTDNPALKELYAMRDQVSLAQAAAGTAMGVAAVKSGFAITGAASWSTIGASTTAISFVPAVIALAGAKYAHGKLEAVSETWLSEEKDWLKKTPSELRSKMSEMGPGEQSYWQGAAGGTRLGDWVNRATMTNQQYAKWQEQVGKTIEDANEGTRFSMTRAYLAQTTELHRRENESDASYKERSARFLADEAMFVASMSEGTFGLQMNPVYRNAHTHAEIRALCEELTACGGSQVISIERTDDNGKPYEKEFDIADYGQFKNPTEYRDGICALDIIHAFQKQQRGITMMQSALLKEMGADQSKREALLQRSMLLEVRHELAQCDEKLLTADLRGWEFGGGEAEQRDLVRYAVSKEFRNLLHIESVRLHSKELATPEDMEKSIKKLMFFLQQNPAEFEKLAAREKNKPGEADSAVYLDLGWNMNNLDIPNQVSKAA